MIVSLAMTILLQLFPREDLRSLQQKVAPSVVALRVERESDPASAGMGGTQRSLLDYYRRPPGEATGTVIGEEGLIVTSFFNVAGTVKKIVVTFHDGRTLEGTMLGYDQERDIALIGVATKGLAVLERGSTSALRQGEPVAAVGRPSSSAEATLNVGIVSAIHRWEDTAIQTDAELNYGNVGGPVVDRNGKLLGVACHIDNRAFWGQSSGVGFATKIEEIDKLLPRLKAGEKIEKRKRPSLGVMAAEDPAGRGVSIMQVTPDSPAAQAGIREGDIIVDMEGEPLETPEELAAQIRRKKIGDEARLTLLRGGERLTIVVRLGEAP
ncbi:MAG: hypothetical protein A2Z34_00250 [Planctomycetes bacterium RBG_16_59_8]|nr:MAG: hypothetical protein A2Z34_00250 [Planctomycetes bacterium RBG_16_59_8]